MKQYMQVFHDCLTLKGKWTKLQDLPQCSVISLQCLNAIAVQSWEESEIPEFLLPAYSSAKKMKNCCTVGFITLGAEPAKLIFKKWEMGKYSILHLHSKLQNYVISL